MLNKDVPGPASHATSIPDTLGLDGLARFEYLLSWKDCCLTINGHRPSRTSNQSSILSLPPLALDGYGSQSQPDIWTQTGWSKAHVRYLFEALLTWDSLPFCLFSKSLFLQDYDSGSDRFCSSALVHALLALAIRLVNEDKDDFRFLPNGLIGSQMFFETAMTIVRDTEASLPNIQAIGILSLYHLRCGNEVDAYILAESFTSKITNLCLRESLESIEEQYAWAQAVTYSGAVSLSRYDVHGLLLSDLQFDILTIVDSMFSLVTGKIFHAHNHTSGVLALDSIPPYRRDINDSYFEDNRSMSYGSRIYAVR